MDNISTLLLNDINRGLVDMNNALIHLQAKHDVIKLVYEAVTFLPNTTQAELFFMEGGIAALEDSIETIKGVSK